MTVHDCAAKGHVWLEADGSLYVRHDQRPKGLVPIHCAYCDRTTEAEAYARHTSKPLVIPPAPVKSTP